MKTIMTCAGCLLMVSTILISSSTNAKAQDVAADSTDAPWYNIKYECYASDAKGLEILQVVKDSNDDYLDIEIHLRFNELHPKYFRNVLLSRYIRSETEQHVRYERWIALHNAGLNNGTVWTSSETIRIPRTWSHELGPNPYTATWDDDRQRYRLSSWPDEEPYNASFERELFGVRLECYQHEVDPQRWTHIMDLDQ